MPEPDSKWRARVRSVVTVAAFLMLGVFLKAGATLALPYLPAWAPGAFTLLAVVVLVVAAARWARASRRTEPEPAEAPPDEGDGKA